MCLARSKTEPRLFTSPFMGEAGEGAVSLRPCSFNLSPPYCAQTENIVLPLHREITDWFAGKGWAPRAHQLAVLEATEAGDWRC